MKNLEADIELLKYKIELLTYFINDTSEYPFFQFCLENDITKAQEKALMKLLNIYSYRNKGTKNEYHEKNRTDNNLREFLRSFNLDLEELYIDKIPSYSEFQKHINQIFKTDFSAKLLLKKLIDQGIQVDLCEYLLSNETEATK